MARIIAGPGPVPPDSTAAATETGAPTPSSEGRPVAVTPLTPVLPRGFVRSAAGLSSGADDAGTRKLAGWSVGADAVRRATRGDALVTETPQVTLSVRSP